MAFSFPAYHTESFATTVGRAVARVAVLDAIKSLGWKLKHDSADLIRASVGFNFWSTGERIEIQLHPRGRLLITSRCWMPTQCFDWGKNEQNVMSLIAELRKAFALAQFTEGTSDTDSELPRASRPASSEQIQDRTDRIK